jgi:hypothetical protein
MDRVGEELARVGCLLVDDRTLRRIIKRHRGLAGLGLQVPHARCYALPRAELAALLEGGDQALAALPERVTVIATPRAPLADGDPAAWTRAWRAIFHARVHQAFDELLARDALGPAAIRARIHRIGQTEFDEVRLVLRQEDLLLPPVDDVSTYVEFAALYLELVHFGPHALERTFPSLGDAPAVAATLALDVDAAALLAAARPARAPARPIADGGPRATARPARRRAPARRYDPGAARHAAAARRKGNRVRAAILALRAGDAVTARADLDALMARLGRALGGAPTDGWTDALLPVAQHAAAQRVMRFTAGARLLHDLQAACVVAERDLLIVDAVTWARSFGRQPVVRPLPATREVRVLREVRAAAKKIARCDLTSSDERERLAAAVHAMVVHANQNARAMLRPKLEAALAAVKLTPRHLPERVAEKKIVDELLDHAVTVGRLSIGNLRDAIADNDLKLPDLRLPQLVTGDQFLRADHILAGSLDGVYRRGPIYLRLLQKVSSVLAGLALGRLITLYLLLPVVGSFFVVEGLQHMIAPVAKWMHREEPHIATRPTFIMVGFVVFLLLHAPWFRSAALVAVRAVGAALWARLDALARRLWHIRWVPPVSRWLLLPGLPAGLAALILHGVARWVVAGILYAVTAAIVNSAAAEEMVSDWLLRSGRHLTQRILPGLIKYGLQIFSSLIELLERGMYHVDELLLFRPNQSKATKIAKGGLGALWFGVSYVLRIYVNLFIEPTVNPIKHFPVVTVAAKVILPFTPQMIGAISGPVGRVVGPTLGASFAAFTVLVLPGLAGFLAWELSGNWKLYRETRPEALAAVAIGSHGESMVGFMKPGFHSGTVPKLHARLRRAAWNGHERGVARAREGLHHVEEAIVKFTDRQLVSMLGQTPAFSGAAIAVGHVDLDSNRIRIELTCPAIGAAPAVLAIEQQSGWLVASIPRAGWIDRLDEDQRRVLEIALTGFYKRSGVDLVREQIEHVLTEGRGDVPAYDVADEGLLVWPGPGFDTEIVYDLEAAEPVAVVRGGAPAAAPPAFAGAGALFGREPVTWAAWEATWELVAIRLEPRQVRVGPSLLPAVRGG